MKEIKFLDLKALHDGIAVEIREAIDKVLAHGQYILGPEVKTFDYKWADFCATRMSIGMANGTAALHALLHCLNIGRGDEVICPSHTFIATAESIRLTGATPVFAEIDPETMLMNPKSVADLIRSRTKAIVPVHLYGMPCDMDGLNQAAQSRGIPIIEDAAQGHGATYKGKIVGGLGHAAAFSFFPGKNLGAFGDAGAATTNDIEFGELVRQFTDHGRISKFESGTVGTNYRLDTLQAGILIAKLRHLKSWNAQRRLLAKRYREILSQEPFVSHGLKFQATTPGAESCYHHFVIRVPNRDAVMEGLKSRGVPTGIHYPIPCHLQPSMLDISEGPGSLLHTERAADSIISMPICPTLTESDVDFICDALRATIMFA